MKSFMTIKHLVVSGGGPLGFRYLGALQELEEKEYWQMENIESIYGTSIGSVIGAFLCLKFDWETLTKYIVERPWKDAFKIHVKQILDSYYNKGLFDVRIMETIFKPLLQAKDLELTITLQEFYEFSKIDLHIFVFELNNFETVEFSHATHPNVSLLKLLTMSSALPGVFMPIVEDNKCYIDGGVMCNFPINECLRDHGSKKEEILAIMVDNKENKNVEVSECSSLLEYVICLTINSMNFIRNTNKLECIENTLKIQTSEQNPLSLEIIQEAVKSSEFRRQWMNMGKQDASYFLQTMQPS
jgi:predicted acylesterase/phospholipase RssA